MTEDILSIDSSPSRAGGAATVALWIARFTVAASSVVVVRYLRR